MRTACCSGFGGASSVSRAPRTSGGAVSICRARASRDAPRRGTPGGYRTSPTSSRAKRTPTSASARDGGRAASPGRWRSPRFTPTPIRSRRAARMPRCARLRRATSWRCGNGSCRTRPCGRRPIRRERCSNSSRAPTRPPPTGAGGIAAGSSGRNHRRRFLSTPFVAMRTLRGAWQMRAIAGIVALFSAAVSLCAQAPAKREAQGAWGGKTKGVGHYADVNGIKLYYETAGTGRPLVLLHGGLGALEMFGPNLAALAKGRQVIAVDLQGHGRTADIDRPLSVALMADDIAALIEHLGLASADVMGYSLGGGVALQTAIRHPEVVRKLVVVSSAFKRDGWYPEVLAGMAAMNAEAARFMVGSPPHQVYVAAAPDAEGWIGMVSKTGDLLRQDYDWSE